MIVKYSGLALAVMLPLACVLTFGQTDRPTGEPASELLEQFKNSKIFYEQFDLAKKIVALEDKRVLQGLEPWLRNEDRHIRGNAAFIFASLGDERGFEVIKAILVDRSNRPMGQGVPAAPWGPQAQISADRYYAAHLFGDLKDPRAVPILIPLLKDQEVRLIVAWSLGEIGDIAAIPPLEKMLKHQDQEMRYSATLALDQLRDKEAQRSRLEGHRIKWHNQN